MTPREIAELLRQQANALALAAEGLEAGEYVPVAGIVALVRISLEPLE